MKTMKGYGLKPSPNAVRDYDFYACCGNTELEIPSKFALPIDDWATVLDQLNINACVSFALSTVQEVNYFKKTGDHQKWSPGYIYGNPLCRNGYDGKGMYLRTAISGTMKTGFVPLQNFDILKEMPEMQTFVECRTDLFEAGKKWALKGFVNLNYGLTSKKIESMKRALYEYQVPLVVASHNYFGGGHAFVIYGWDDDMKFKRYNKGDTIFFLRNSWGEDYENGGNYFIPVSKLDEVFLPLFEDIPFPFTDVKQEDWFYNDIRKAFLSGLVHGVSKAEFKPYNNLMRGDVAVIGSRLLYKLTDSINTFIKTLKQKGWIVQDIELQTLSDKYPFNDISKDDYYYDEIGISFANGILTGTSENLFEPTRDITRGEFAAIVVRLYTYIVDLINTAIPSAKIPMPSPANIEYHDVSENAWYYNYICLAKQLAFMFGDDDGAFRPDDNIIRAEATVVLNRLFKEVDKLLEAIC